MSSSDRGRNRDPYSIALDTLHERLRAGVLTLGEPLPITEVAAMLGLSATPVREALACLAGKGLIERRRGRGYFVRRLDGPDCLELYELRRLYLLAALSAEPLKASLPVETDRPPQEQLSALLLEIVVRADNRALLEAYDRLSDRLAPAELIAAKTLGVDAEVLALSTATDRDHRVQAINTLHDARSARAYDIARSIRTSSGYRRI